MTHRIMDGVSLSILSYTYRSIDYVLFHLYEAVHDMGWEPGLFGFPEQDTKQRETENHESTCDCVYMGGSTEFHPVFTGTKQTK